MSHVGSSPSRIEPVPPAIGRIFNHWTTKEVPHFFFLMIPVKWTAETWDGLLFPSRTTYL